LQEEEEERSDRWKSFLERRTESPVHDLKAALPVDEAAISVEENEAGSSQLLHEKSAQGPHKFESWKPIRPSLGNIEHMMGLRVEKKHSSAVRLQPKESTHPVMVEEAKVLGDSDDEFYDAKVKVLSEEIKHHVKEEEKRGGIFTGAREKELDLDALGEQMLARKEELMAQFEKNGLPKPVTLTMKAPPPEQRASA
jgi:hypothetical protein